MTCNVMSHAVKVFLCFMILIPASGAVAQVPVPSHVVVVIEENHDYGQIIGSSAAPYINGLLADSKAALFTNSWALTHPSQPNYLMLFSGSNQGVTNDNVPQGLPFTTVNLGGSLVGAGKTFAGYSEDLPSTGYSGANYGGYARKHNPWVNWQGSPTNGIPPEANRPLSNFPTDFDSLPRVSFVIPNQDNDMHNGSDPSTIVTGDSWLQQHLDGYIQWAKTHNSLFILTFDEGTSTGTNQIVTIFIGAMVKGGRYAEVINHYSLLRTLEDMFTLPHSGGSSTSLAITDCWTTATGMHEPGPPIPERTALEPCYPNPFNPATTIRFHTATEQVVTLTIYDIMGREVKLLLNRLMSPGEYQVPFDATGLASGCYMCMLRTPTMNQTRSLLLIR